MMKVSDSVYQYVGHFPDREQARNECMSLDPYTCTYIPLQLLAWMQSERRLETRPMMKVSDSVYQYVGHFPERQEALNECMSLGLLHMHIHTSSAPCMDAVWEETGDPSTGEI